MKLTENFTVNEFCKSATADRKGIINELPEDLIDNAISVCTDICQPAREHFNIAYLISSGYRCLQLNRELDSQDYSQHVLAEAVDIEIPGISNFDLACWIRDNCEFDQLILEYYTPGKPTSGWVHGSSKLDKSENRREILTYTPKGNKVKGLFA